MSLLKKILSLLGLYNPETERKTLVEKSVHIPIEFQQKENSNQEDIINITHNITSEFVYAAPLTYPVVLLSNSTTSRNYTSGIQRNDKGALEDFFFDSLVAKFNERVRNDVRIHLQDLDVIPDIVYIDKGNGKFFVIEIDEPYTLNNLGEFIPIHYKGEDDNRNIALLKNGWSVIRFAEEQIACSTNECIDFISNHVEGTTQNSLQEVLLWTREESIKMIQENWRDTYMPFGFDAKQKTDTRYSFRRLKISFVKALKSQKGDEYVVVYLYQSKRTVNKAIEFVGDLECWIPKDVFWQNVESSETGKLFKRNYPILTEESLALLLADMEAVGCSNGRYFNLFDNSKFRIVHLDFIVSLVQKYGDTKSYMEIINEVVELRKQQPISI